MTNKKTETVLFLFIMLGLLWLGYSIPRHGNDPAPFTPSVYIDNTIYFHSGNTLTNPDPEYLNEIGYITEEISPYQAPSKNFQANLYIKGAPVYRYADESLYEKKILLSDDILIYYDDKYYIYELEEHHHTPTERISE